MKITFIGTSHGVPERDRRCSCYMIEAGDKVYFIDMGTCAMEELIARGHHPNEVAAVFFTHPHSDHTDGLIQFAGLLNWYFKDAKPAMFLPHEKMKDAIALWIEACTSSLREDHDFRLVTPGLLYDDGVLRVTSVPTKHCPHSCAYIVECEGKTVLFTGDLAHPSVDYPAEAKTRTLDLVICETAHFSPKEFLPVWDESDVKQVLHTHVAPRWQSDLEEISAEKHIYVFGVAQDGMIVAL